MATPETNPFLAEMNRSERKPNAGQAALRLARGAPMAAAGAAYGAGKEAVGGLVGTAKLIAPYLRPGPQLGLGPIEQQLLEGATAHGTPTAETTAKSALETIGPLVPIPTPRGPIFPGQMIQGAQRLPTAFEPGLSPFQAGERFGGAAMQAIGFGAPGPLAHLGPARFRPVEAPAAPEAPGTTAMTHRVEFTPEGPVYVPNEPAGPARPAPAISRPAISGAAPAPKELPPAKPGLTASKVRPGFTPVESDYQVWIGEKPQPAQPGGKAVGKPEFRQFKSVRAFSEADAIQKVQDELGAEAPTFDYKAQELKGTATPQSPARTEALAAGKEQPPVTARERYVSRETEAQARARAKQAAPVAQPPPEPAPIRLPGEVEKKPGAVPPPAVPAAEPVRSTSLPGEQGSKGPPVEEPPIAGRSKVVREPTPIEAAAMQAGETQNVGGTVVHKLAPEAERRVAERRGGGMGGATAMYAGEAPGIERRLAAPAGRRAGDVQRLQDIQKESAANVERIRKAKTYGELVTIHQDLHPGVGAPDIGSPKLRALLLREAQAGAKGAAEALGTERVPPKAGAAAEAASAKGPPPAEDHPVQQPIEFHAGLHPRALEPLWIKVGDKARQIRDHVLIPKDVREPLKPGEPFQDWWLRGALPKTGDSFRGWFARTWQNAAREFVSVYDTRRFPYFHEQMDQFKVEATTRLAKITDDMADVVHPMVYRADPVTGALKRRPAAEIAELGKQFNLLVGISDLEARAKAGALTPASAYPEFANLNQAEVTAALTAEAKAAMLAAPPAVREAHAAWVKLMTETRNELVKRGKLGAQDRLGWAYAPNVIDDMTWSQLWRSTPPRVKEATRPYVRRFIGHLRKHDPNMIRAGLKHVVDVQMDNLLDDFAHSVGQSHDQAGKLWQTIRDKAKESGRTFEEVAKETPIPEKLAVFRVGGRKHLWNPATVVDLVVQRAILNDPDIGLHFDNVWQLREYAGTAEGKARPAYLVPREIADQLNNFREARGPLDRLASQFNNAISVLKASILFSVYVPYRTVNQLGDLYNVLYRLPGKLPVLPGLKVVFGYGPKAIGELARQAATGKTTPGLTAASGVGVPQNVRAQVELGALRGHKELAPFVSPERGALAKPIFAAGHVARQALSGLMLFDSVAEGWLRYATWLYLVDKEFPFKRAERVASEIIGDYRQVDPFTSSARRSGLMPFLTWIRQMIPGWSRWATGAKLGRYFEQPELEARTPEVMRRARVLAATRKTIVEAELARMREESAEIPPNVSRPGLEAPKGTDPTLWKLVHSGRYSQATAGQIAALAAPLVLLWYWNNVQNKDANDQIDEATKRRMTYVILPWWKTTDGRALMFGFPSPVDAVLSFFGLGDPVTRAKKFYEATQQGPQATAKFVGNQLGESALTTVSSVGEQFGPPVDLLKQVVDIPGELYKEKQKPAEKQDWDAFMARQWKRIYREQVPGAYRILRARDRHDLDGLPSWATNMLRDYPWGTIFYVPLSQEERRRRRRAGKPAALKPGVGGPGSALKPQLGVGQ